MTRLVAWALVLGGLVGSPAAWAQDDDAPETTSPEDAPLAIPVGEEPTDDEADPVADDETSEPPESPADVVAPLPESLSAGELRRMARKAAVRERFSGPALPPEADFLQRHVDLRVRLAFNGTEPGPFSIITSLAGWNELSLALDVGVASWRDFTIGVGVSGHYGASLLLGAINGRVANYDDYEFGWGMWDAGGLVRATFHFTQLRSLDPYVLGGIGASAFGIEAVVGGWPLVETSRHVSPYVRIELGGGLATQLKGTRWMAGVELRYLLTVETDPIDRFLIENPATDETAIFVFAPAMRPPKGFCWVIHVGYRFN